MIIAKYNLIIVTYHFIDKYSKHFGTAWLLNRLDICPNAYYNYRKHRKSAKQTKKAFVLNTIKTIYHDAGGKPRYRMMQQLLANKGIQLSPHTVHNYMKKDVDNNATS